MSRIIKTQKSGHEDDCKRHLFPRLENGRLLEAPISRENGNFRPICSEAADELGEEGFERLFKTDGDLVGGIGNPPDLEGKHADELKEEFSKGFVEGENSGVLSERQRVDPAIRALEASVLELQECRKSLVKHFEKASVELAIAIAEKIVCHEVSTNKQTLIDVLKAAVDQAGRNEVLEIRLNPADFELLEDAGFSPSKLNAENASIEEDNAVSCGGCVLKTDFGSVDAMIEHQLEAVSEALREKL